MFQKFIRWILGPSIRKIDELEKSVRKDSNDLLYFMNAYKSQMKSVEEKILKHVKSEEFISSVVDRINRLQLSNKKAK